MKKNIYIIFILLVFTTCSKDEPIKKNEPQLDVNYILTFYDIKDSGGNFYSDIIKGYMQFKSDVFWNYKVCFGYNQYCGHGQYCFVPIDRTITFSNGSITLDTLPCRYEFNPGITITGDSTYFIFKNATLFDGGNYIKADFTGRYRPLIDLFNPPRQGAWNKVFGKVLIQKD